MNVVQQLRDLYKSHPIVQEAASEIERLRALKTSATREMSAHFGYDRVVEIFNTDEVAGSFLREDGEGGFSSGVYRMAREIERIRAINAELVEAIEPFAVKDRPSLLDTLGHINREHIEKARNALAGARSAELSRLAKRGLE